MPLRIAFAQLEHLPVRDRVDVRALRHVLEDVLVGDHDVRRLRVREVVLRVFVPSLPIFTSGWRQGLDLLGDVVDVADETLVLERDEVAVQADEEVDVALPRLRLGSDAVDELSRGGDRYEDRVDVAVEALEDVLPDSLLLGDRAELAEVGRDLADVLDGSAVARLAPASPPRATRAPTPPARTSRSRLSSGSSAPGSQLSSCQCS